MSTARLKIHRSEQGFTIIELLIATTVLSMILLLVTTMMIGIGNLYYKGINQARVQDNVRSVTDEVSQYLQLNGRPPLQQPLPPNPNGTQAYCIGTTRYTYVLYRQIGANTGSPDFQSRHVLWRDTINASGSCPLANLNNTNPSLGTDVGGGNAKNGTELIAPNSRLMKFSILPLTSPYTINIEVAYGDNDLLCDTGTANDCTTPYSNTSVMAKLVGGSQSSPTGDMRCRGSLGDQFCSTADLNTTVAQRLTAN